MKNALAVFVAASVAAAAAVAQTDTTFTYQGSLAQNGSPANGTFDLIATLWDAPTGGSQVGSAVQLDGLPVQDGLLTMSLDFGAGALRDARWVQISVDGTALSPRQALTAAPHSATTRGIYVDPTETFVGIGRETPVTGAEVFGISRDTDGFAGMYANAGAAGRPFYGYALNGVPASYHYLDGATGSLHLVHGGAVALTVSPSRRVAIGLTNPGAMLHVEANDGRAIRAFATNDHAITCSTISPFQSGIRGSSDSTGEGYGVFGITSGIEGVGVWGHANMSTGVSYGVKGSCNSSNGYDFYASGPGINYGAPSSIRWKRNISAVTDPLGTLASIRGVYYEWDAEHGGRRDIGFIGEEVGKVVPEIVAFEPDGEFVTGMDYGRMTPLLVEGVNALRARHESESAALHTEIEALRAQNAELRTRLDAMESLLTSLAAHAAETASTKEHTR